MKKFFFIAIISFLLVSFTDPYTIKRVSDKEYRYEFYTINKKVSINNSKQYHWFKGGKVHNTQGGVAGQLLNDDFKKFYHSNQLAEQGRFKKGLKVGQWKKWFENGTLASTQQYNNGLSNGEFMQYNEQGKLIEQGKYKRGRRHGFWINHIKQDTIQFKKGEVFVPKPKLSKEEKAILKEQKKKDKEVLKQQKENEKVVRKAEKEKSKSQGRKEKTKKDNFFTRLFSKNEK